MVLFKASLIRKCDTKPVFIKVPCALDTDAAWKIAIEKLHPTTDTVRLEWVCNLDDCLDVA